MGLLCQKPWDKRLPEVPARSFIASALGQHGAVSILWKHRSDMPDLIADIHHKKNI